MNGNQPVYSNITKYFSILIPVLAIFITLSTLLLMNIIPSTTFIDYLEDVGKGAYSKLIEYHKVGFIICFSALFLNIFLQIAYDLNIIFTIVAIFLTFYSFFYSISLIKHILKLMDYRIKYRKNV